MDKSLKKILIGTALAALVFGVGTASARANCQGECAAIGKCKKPNSENCKECKATCEAKRQKPIEKKK